MQNNTGRTTQHHPADTERAHDRKVQNAAIFAVIAILAALIIFCALQDRLIAGCSSAVSSGDAVSAADILSPADVTSDGDAVSDADAAVSAADVISPSDVVYYPEVHIEGIVLPEEYGDGLFDEQAAMWLINEYRRQHGLHQLLPDPYHLTLVARIRLEECLEFFSHDRPDGSRFFTAFSQVGIFYSHCAENLAYGQYSAEQVVLDWIQSPTHRDNLLSPLVTYMSVRTSLGEDGIPRWVFEAYS